MDASRFVLDWVANDNSTGHYYRSRCRHPLLIGDAMDSRQRFECRAMDGPCFGDMEILSLKTFALDKVISRLCSTEQLPV